MASKVEATLKKFGVPEREIKKTTKDKGLLTKLEQVLSEAKLDENSEAPGTEVVDLLMQLSRKFPQNAVKHRPFVIDYIMKGKLGEPQLEESFKYFKGLKDGADFDVKDYESKCGVGVVVSDEEIEKNLKVILEENKAEFGTEPQKKQGLLWKLVHAKMPFAPPSKVKVQLDKILATQKEDQTRGSVKFPKPEENKQNDIKLLEEHLKATGGKVVTRFPPEPNGYLHIGHAKAMHLNFGYAKKYDGMCYMRFDDTNPETEDTEYVDSILDIVKWMGHKWCNITYASDYFDKLHELAIELIKRGHAYVCHQTGDEIEQGRKTHTPSPYRDRSVEENLKLFEQMRTGHFAEGKAILRMKQDMNSANSTMWDLVAYRIKPIKHHRSGDKWIIYPSYDFTHCLNDSLENITHSLCTLEFVVRRESYNWLINALSLYRPVVWEYARLQLTHTLLSKRKLIKLVKENYVSGWDDPRLPTLVGFRRKGYSPDGINNFCEDVGVTRNNSVIPIERLEEWVRKDLNANSRRIFAIFDPIKVNIRNLTEKVTVECPNVPKVTEKGSHKLSLSSNIYIERTDFKENDEKGYYGLALNSEKPKFVKLKYSDINIRIVDAVKDDKGSIVSLVAEYDSKVKTEHALHWIDAETEPTKIEVRNYNHLFMSDEPVKVEDWLKDINPNSIEVTSAIIDPSVKEIKPYDRVQFERVGYYCCDPDSKDGKYVFNRTVTLKESTWRKKN